jgi:hypothetical protein
VKKIRQPHASFVEGVSLGFWRQSTNARIGKMMHGTSTITMTPNQIKHVNIFDMINISL